MPGPARAEPTLPGTLQNDLVPASDCNYCHAFPNGVAFEDIPPFSPIFGWQGSMMGNSARDPVFWAGVALAAQDDPEGTEDCIRCHSPTAFLEGRGTAISPDELLEQDLEGVTCEVCHRMTDQGALGNAQYNIDDVLVGDAVPRRGPWDYTDGVPAPAEHSTLFDPFTASSEMCGTCHDVTTSKERVDANGEGLGVAFNEQRTYSEWANSSFAVEGEGFRSCQDCHMVEVPDSAACREYIGVQSHAFGNRRHDLLGANRFMMQLLRDNDIGSYSALDNGIARLDEFIQTAAAMEVTPPKSIDLATGADGLQVTVTNNTGHKLPTGYSEGRVMWLEVVASYGDTVVFSSGTWDQASGTYEADPQLRRYEGVAQDHTDGTKFHLLLNDQWVEDTRIPPLGLRADLETDPVTDRYTPLEDGTWPNFDVHSYSIAARPEIEDSTPADASDDNLTVRVRLLYVINTAQYIEVLANDNTTNEAGNDVAAMFDEAGGATPLVLAEQELSVPISGFGRGAESSTGVADESDGGPAPTDDTATTAATTSPTGGSNASDETGGTAAQDEASDEGCACQASASPGRGPALSLLLMLGLWGLRRRR